MAREHDARRAKKKSARLCYMDVGEKAAHFSCGLLA